MKLKVISDGITTRVLDAATGAEVEDLIAVRVDWEHDAADYSGADRLAATLKVRVTAVELRETR